MPREKLKTNFTSNYKGVTLIALVVTIIIMLILLGVTISGSLNGRLFNITKEAASETQRVSDKEYLQSVLITLRNKGKGKFDFNKLKEKLPEDWTVLENDSKCTSPKGNSFLIDENGEIAEGRWIEAKSGITNGEVILKIGDFVNYIPDQKTYSVVGGDYGTGYEDVQTFTTGTGDESLKWRVFSLSDGRIQLMSEPSKTSLYLKSYAGYNHGVDILNDICKTLYSKSMDGKEVATARSINVEDLLSLTTYNLNTIEGYKTLVDMKKTSSHPAIFELEDGYYRDGVEVEGGLSESTGLNDGEVNSDGVTEYRTLVGGIVDNLAKTSLSIEKTGYSINVKDYLTDKGRALESALFGHYWIASRYRHGNALWNCGIRETQGIDWIGTQKLDVGDSSSFVSIVSLDPSVSATKDEKNSTDSTTYWNIEF